MKPRFGTEILIFLSGYTPLWLIFFIQNIYFFETDLGFKISLTMLIISIISCIILKYTITCIDSPYPSVRITSINNQSRELLTYTLPYIASLIGLDVNNLLYALSFGIFLAFMFLIFHNTGLIYQNPILIIWNYNMYEITYADSLEKIYSGFLIAKKTKENILKDTSQKIANIGNNIYMLVEKS